jgi:putative oxidoreductase
MTHTTLTTVPATAAGAATARGRAATAALWALQVLGALAFLMAAFSKFSRYPAAVEAFDRMGFGDWFIYAIGTLELAGAVGLLVPVLSGLAGLGLTALLTGAIVIQLTLFDPATAITPLAYMVPVAIVAWGRRRETTRLRRLLGRAPG